jgi:hypothetical protein
METEFFGLSLTRNELLEMQTALIQRYILEDELHREKGMEPVAEHKLLCRVDDLLRLPNRDLDSLSDALDDELWEFSWFAFTEEWAWFRASQETRRELGPSASKMNQEEMDKLIERRFTKNFEKYISEVEMKDRAPVKRQTAPRKA